MQGLTSLTPTSPECLPASLALRLQTAHHTQAALTVSQAYRFQISYILMSPVPLLSTVSDVLLTAGVHVEPIRNLSFHWGFQLAAQILHNSIRNLEALKGVDGTDLWAEDLEHTPFKQQCGNTAGTSQPN